MKNIIGKLIAISLLAFLPVVNIFAQPAPPASNSTVLSGGTQINCPIGNGYLILLALGIAYGFYKVIQMRRAEKLA